MAKNAKQQAAIAISMKKAGKKPLAKKQIGGGSGAQGPISKETARTISTIQKTTPIVKKTTFDKLGKVADYDRNPANAKNVGEENIAYEKGVKEAMKKKGGAVTGKKISVAKSPRPSTAGTGSAGKYVTPKKSGMLKLGGSIKSKKK